MEPMPMPLRAVLEPEIISALRDLAEPGDPDPFEEIAECFLEHAAAKLSIMRSASDPAAVRAAAHSLRGMSGTIGALHLSRLCETLEYRPWVPGTTDRVLLTAAIDREFWRVRRAIEVEIGRGPASKAS
jgi:HPt (histidine-containing phosphotransfer) domain-containing protein